MGPSHGRPRAARQAGVARARAALGAAAPVLRRPGRRRRGERANDSRQPVGPGFSGGALADQILAQFDQRVGEAARGGDGVDRVAGQPAVVGLVVADRIGADVALRAERANQRRGQARIGVP